MQSTQIRPGTLTLAEERMSCPDHRSPGEDHACPLGTRRQMLTGLDGHVSVGSSGTWRWACAHVMVGPVQAGFWPGLPGPW